MASVPVTAPRKAADGIGEPQRTAPLSVIVGTLQSLQNAVVPALAATFGVGFAGYGVFIGLFVVSAFLVILWYGYGGTGMPPRAVILTDFLLCFLLRVIFVLACLPFFMFFRRGP